MPRAMTRELSCAGAAAALTIAVSTTFAPAAGRHDGSWKFVVVSERGDCGNSSFRIKAKDGAVDRLTVKIMRGRYRPVGLFGVDGTVAIDLVPFKSNGTLVTGHLRGKAGDRRAE